MDYLATWFTGLDGALVEEFFYIGKLVVDFGSNLGIGDTLLITPGLGGTF